jgi:hypothetical protein
MARPMSCSEWSGVGWGATWPDRGPSQPRLAGSRPGAECLWPRRSDPVAKAGRARQFRLLAGEERATRPEPVRLMTRGLPAGRFTVLEDGKPQTSDSRGAQDFTNDRTKLLATLDHYSPGWTGLSETSNQVANPGWQFQLGALRTVNFVMQAMIATPHTRKAAVWITPGTALGHIDRIIHPREPPHSPRPLRGYLTRPKEASLGLEAPT